MNFVADEGVERLIVDRLRQEGHSVWYVAEMQPSITDDVVLGIANQQGALLLTADKDFGELVFRLKRLCDFKHKLSAPRAVMRILRLAILPLLPLNKL